jgi:hypothetical protein
MDLTRQVGRTPNPTEFLEQFETVMNGPVVPDLATRLRGVTVAIEEMESVGSVSDFDEEWPAPTQGFDDASEPKGPVARTLNVSHFSTPRKQGTNWPTLAAAAVVVSGLLAWWLIPKATSSHEPAVAVVTMPLASDPPVPPKPKLKSSDPATKPAPVIVATAKVTPPPAPAVPKNPESKPVILAARPAFGPGPATMALKPELAGTDLAKKTDLPPTPPVFASVPGLAKTKAAMAPPESVTSTALASSVLLNTEPSQPTPPATKPVIVTVAAAIVPEPKPAPAVAPTPQPAAEPAPVIVAAAIIPAPKPAPAVAPTPQPAVKRAQSASLLVATSPEVTPAMAAKNQQLPPATGPAMITATLPATLASVTFAPRPLPTLANDKIAPPALPTLAIAPYFPVASAKPVLIPPTPTQKPTPPAIAAAKKPAILAATSLNVAIEVKAKSPPAATPAPAKTAPTVANKAPPPAAKPVAITAVTASKTTTPPNVTTASVLKPATPAPGVPLPQAARGEVIIRKAILPTPEEIAKFKAAQAQDQDSKAGRLDTAQAQ